MVKNASTLKPSVVVIAKNAGKTIAKCVESLLHQTSPCEIVVVDGHSSDGTRDIVRGYPARLVEAPLRDTYGVSRNVGVRHAVGDIILFQDADDFVDPTWCESLVKHFSDDPTVGIVIAKRSAPTVYGSNDWFKRLLSKRRPVQKEQSLDVFRAAQWYEVTTKGSAFRKSAVLESGGFDEDMFFGTEDKELAYRIFKKGYRVLYDPEIAVYCKPQRGVMEYLQDKFVRAGMGHGHVRRKHGVYRPPLREAGALALIVFGIVSWNLNVALALIGFLASLVMLKDLIGEASTLNLGPDEIVLIPPYFLTRFVGRILEFMGFAITYVIPARYLRAVQDGFRK